MNKAKQVESVAWDFALEFEKSCKPSESSSEFVYRLRDMLSSLLHKDRDAVRDDVINGSMATKIRKAEIEAMITGLQESMRPLLEEWSKIKEAR